MEIMTIRGNIFTTKSGKTQVSLDEVDELCQRKMRSYKPTNRKFVISLKQYEYLLAQDHSWKFVNNKEDRGKYLIIDLPDVLDECYKSEYKGKVSYWIGKYINGLRLATNEEIEEMRNKGDGDNIECST